jgi:uncharacterized protein YbjT (DUF2867 family)
MKLILGGTGKTGRRIIEQLGARGVAVRVGSRSAQTPFDWEDPSTWRKALGGVDAIYISYFPDLAAPGAALAIQSLTEMAVEAGVRRLVLLSGRGEPEAQRCEEIVRDCGLEYTLLRASWFAQNFSESYFLDPVLAGEVELPAGAVREPFVDADDIADCAVAALTEPGHVGQLYEITGPRLLTFAEAIAEISRASGRAIQYRQIPLEAYADMLERAQVPLPIIMLVTYLFGEVLDGRNASTADGVMRALKRAPRDFSEYARATAATGVWNPNR